MVSKKLYLTSLLIFFIVVIVFFIGLKPYDLKACDCAGGYFDEEATWMCPDPEPCPPPPPPPCVPTTESCSESSLYRCNDFPVYKCANNSCGKSDGAMEQGVMSYECVDISCTDGCNVRESTEVRGGPFGPDQIGSYGSVPDYQICPASNNDWSSTPPTPVCSGSCYPAPNLKPLNDSSLSPKNVFNGTKPKLPINFGWEDNVANEVAKAPSSCSVGSYEFDIINPSLSKIVTDIQIQRIEDPAYKLECQLKSNTDYQWRVRACLDAGGTDCGAWAKNQSFSTNPSPELISPYDPSWEGSTGVENVALPVTLNWCNVEGAQTYQFRAYILDNSNSACHPLLTSSQNGQKTCEPWPVKKQMDPTTGDKILFPTFSDEEMKFFTKDTTYQWEVAACFDDYGLDCKDWSQEWIFTPKNIALPSSFLLSPQNDQEGKNAVGLPVTLDWADKPGINSYVYEINQVGGGTTITNKTNTSRVSLNFPQLSLNTLYRWKVKSCSDFYSNKCEPDFSEEWYFKTTGQAPNLISPASGEQNVVIPVNFTWENAPGAKSYIFKVSGNGLNLEKTLDKPEFSIDFPEYPVSQETDYSWQVKTCAWDNGKTCGQYGNLQSFKTFRLPPPQNPSPTNNGQFFTDDKSVSWGSIPGAKAYQYQINYLSLSEKETDATCPAMVGKSIFEQPKTTLANSDFVEPKCLGGYQWQTRSCLDINCREVSNWSNSWSFTFLEGGTSQNGLVPCGRSTDNPKTPWKEREPCQIKHAFLLIKIIIDFLLFRMIPIILVLLTIITAVIFYTSFGQAMTKAQVMSLWRAAGIGLIIIFFAWTIVNLFLKATGYNIGIFGNWYQLPF